MSTNRTHHSRNHESSRLSSATCVEGRGLLLMAMGLLFFSALPDAMVVPVLHDLMVARYGVSIGASHAFMCINLLGALMVIGLVNRLQHHERPGSIIALAALLNGLLLATMALPIGFLPTLAVRFFEGAADLVVYAFLFNFIAHTGPDGTKGRRMGAAATSLMLGIAVGIGLGGLLGRIDPILSLWLGAAVCLAVAPVALVLSKPSPADPSEEAARAGILQPATSGPLWPALIMMCSDRAVVGVLISTVPLYFASMARLSSAAIGALIGVSMLMTALGAWPAGLLVEKVGVMRMRLFAGVIFASAFGLIILAALQSMTTIMLVMGAFGLAGAALFASSLMIVCRSGRGPTGMAAFHAAGNLGFLLGPAIAGTILQVIGGDTPGIGVYASILTGAAVIHLVSTAVAFIGATRAGPHLSPASTETNEPASEYATS